MVSATGVPPDPAEEDSEAIAMRRTRDLLSADGWAVGDVHAEGRGFDLYATRGQAQRCVEVKGVWTSASSSGVKLTGNEILHRHPAAQRLLAVRRRPVLQRGRVRCSAPTGTGHYLRRADQAVADLQALRFGFEGCTRENGPGMTRMIERWFPCKEVSDIQQRLGQR